MNRQRYALGVRVRLVAHSAYYDNSALPPVGTEGTIIELPAPGVLGASCKVRWDTGTERWMGSTAEKLVEIL